VVTGHLDRAVLDQLTDVFLDTISHRDGPCGGTGGTVPELTAQTRERLQHTLLAWSIDLLSGPAGFPAYLRRHLLPARFTSLSQPLDLARTTRVVPRTSAKPSSSGTSTAGSQAASSPPPSARSTT